jgi:hypothetical protein
MQKGNSMLLGAQWTKVFLSGSRDVRKRWETWMMGAAK